ncbi:hypothetical protein [Saccharopolyspora spinosa]|uniref:hypothetical protein n=1 Tax=Saccharopolyspora spinosa TaxID=60894 RepID=UPI001ED96AFA|nr:hypothetical protein [Saccharopolyspora spinosa]
MSRPSVHLDGAFRACNDAQSALAAERRTDENLADLNASLEAPNDTPANTISASGRTFGSTRS